MKRGQFLVLFVRLFVLWLYGFVGFLFLLVSGKGSGLWLWHFLDFSLTFFILLCWPFWGGGPGVGLALCCFVVYCASCVLPCVVLLLCCCLFFSSFSIAITSLGEGAVVWSWCVSCVCSICACLVLSVFSSSWCLGRAAICDCGTPFEFSLTVFCQATVSSIKHTVCLCWGFTALLSVQYTCIY